MSEKNTPDGLRPGPTDDPRIDSLDKDSIRESPSPCVQQTSCSNEARRGASRKVSGKGKKLVRQRAPRRQRMNLLEESKRRGAALFYALIDVVASSYLDRGGDGGEDAPVGGGARQLEGSGKTA